MKKIKLLFATAIMLLSVQSFAQSNATERGLETVILHGDFVGFIDGRPHFHIDETNEVVPVVVKSGMQILIETDKRNGTLEKQVVLCETISTSDSTNTNGDTVVVKIKVYTIVVDTTESKE